MAGVIQKPDSLSLSGNINKFILAGSQPVSFILKKEDTVLLESEYIPGADNLLDIDVRDVIESCLIYKLDASNSFYVQTDLAANFTATIDGTDYPFRVIRSGVANLADTATNWLKLHFLTWQPRVKPVTYYAPEWLTYYAVEECTAKLKATYPDKSTKVISLGTCVAGHATTMNLQYSVIAGKLGNTYPSYYEVWTEKSGTKLSESQVYAFSDPMSEDEQWYLFENSLGGLDTFRAAGTNNLNAEHEHNIAEFGDVREEYQVDTQRKYTKNTGYLDEYSRRWLLDFFPSKAKFVYEATAIRKIVVTESNVTYISNELPSSYTFTWQLSEVSSFLNLTKNESDIPDNLVAPDLSSPDFILPPRLAEFPRVQLTEGVLIPAFDPFNPKPTVTTYGAILNTIKNAVIKELEDEIGNIGGGGSGGDCNLEIIELDDPTLPTNKNVFSALRTLDEIKKKIEDNTVTLDARYLRKDIDDFAEGNLEFRKNIFVQGEAGLTNALIVESLYSDIHAADFDVAGFHISAEGDAWLNNIYAKKDSYFAGNLSSPNFSSGFPAGYGWAITWRDVVNAAGVLAKKTHLEIDDATFRGVLRVYEMVISQLLGENGTHLTTDMMKIKSVDIANKIIYLDTEENVLYNPFWTDDVLMVQRFNGMPTPENDYYVTKQYEFAVEETHIGSVDEEGNRVDWIKYKNFVGDESLMAARDTLVRVDNLTNPDRKGIIKQTSVEPGSPYMDIIYAMKTDPENAIRSRFGKLEDLITSYWGQLSGYGLMCDNAYLKGHFMLHTGEDVKTKFEIMEGLFRSEISSIKTQISTKDNYLSNASFATNTDKWSTVNEQNVFAVNGRILMFNNNLYANKKKIAAIVSDAGQRVLRIKNSQVRQVNSDLANKPSLDITGETVVIPTFYVSFKYRCLVPGLLKVGFAGKELYTEENVSVSNDYVLKEFSGKWDGTGDFIVECTGDVYITMLALTTDALADFKLEMKTIIEQTDEHIKLLGEKIDKNAGTITNLGIELDNVNEALKLYATKSTVNDLESRYQASMLELTPAKINATVSEQITRVSESAKAAAIAVANKAQESANKGIADAKAASDRLTGWASDGVISPPEKLTLKQEAKDLASEKVEIIANAGKYGIATTGYVNAYNAYLGELNYHSTATPENIAIRTTFATYQTAYYNARQSILDQIAAKTKQNAQDYADNVGKTISASLNIEKGRIDTLAGKFDANGKLIEGAGWITTTQGNTWYAGKSLENGQNIISYINQTPGNTVINSNRINLVGAVSFSMLSDYTSVNNRINGKASMSDVTNALSNYVTNSGLNSKLSSYALASTLSNYVQSATLTSTLKNYATNTAAGDAANSAATAEFKKLANALVNGTTSVIGGFISTKAIDTDSIYANMASIGGLRIEDGGLFSERYTTGYSSSKFFLYSKGDDAFLGFSASNVWAGIGLNVFPSTIDGTALGRFENMVPNSFGTNYGVSIVVKNGKQNKALMVTGDTQLNGAYSNMRVALYANFDKENSEGIKAGSDFIRLYFRRSNTFVVQNNTGISYALYLPGYPTDIPGDYETSFILDIIMAHTNTGNINIQTPNSQTYLKNENGDIVIDNSVASQTGNLNMNRGDSIRLLYMKQVYYILNRNW
jgi:hypothetical protein|nr:MAG TPA: tail protein [Caudoviricetes sp.]